MKRSETTLGVKFFLAPTYLDPTWGQIHSTIRIEDFLRVEFELESTDTEFETAKDQIAAKKLRYNFSFSRVRRILFVESSCKYSSKYHRNDNTSSHVCPNWLP